MERQRFKAQTLTRSCLPYEGPQHPPPHPECGLLARDKASTLSEALTRRRQPNGTTKVNCSHSRIRGVNRSHTQTRTHTQEATELYERSGDPRRPRLGFSLESYAQSFVYSYPRAQPFVYSYEQSAHSEGVDRAQPEHNCPRRRGHCNRAS